MPLAPDRRTNHPTVLRAYPQQAHSAYVSLPDCAPRAEVREGQWQWNVPSRLSPSAHDGTERIADLVIIMMSMHVPTSPHGPIHRRQNRIPIPARWRYRPPPPPHIRKCPRRSDVMWLDVRSRRMLLPSLRTLLPCTTGVGVREYTRPSFAALPLYLLMILERDWMGSQTWSSASWGIARQREDRFLQTMMACTTHRVTCI
jgi:hypothetical protein